jgi:hypothetical protein
VGGQLRTGRITADGVLLVVENLLVRGPQRDGIHAGSPLPKLRLKRGNAPLETWTRMRCPRRNR